MAKRLTELDSASSIQKGDYLDVSKNMGNGKYRSYKIDFDVLKNYIPRIRSVTRNTTLNQIDFKNLKATVKLLKTIEEQSKELIKIEKELSKIDKNSNIRHTQEIVKLNLIDLSDNIEQKRLDREIIIAKLLKKKSDTQSRTNNDIDIVSKESEVKQVKQVKQVNIIDRLKKQIEARENVPIYNLKTQKNNVVYSIKTNGIV